MLAGVHMLIKENHHKTTSTSALITCFSQ